jgi:ABC-type glycerol-3-phosphate transport system substrate-binding protein
MERKPIRQLLVIGLLALLITGCSNLPQILPATPTTATQALTTPTPTTPPTPVVSEGPVLINLTIWVPPQFAPSQDTDAGLLLQERLNAFNQQHPNLQVNFRIKAETGPASLLESLYATSGVAPLVLPDLVLLSTADMQIAAEQNLIFPYPEGYPADDDTDWYNVASNLSSYQNQRYLLPLGADAMVMVYNTELMETAPRNWDELITNGHLISFPAADPQATFTLAQYVSTGGGLKDADDNITLQTEPLAVVLTHYKQALAANILPPNPTQINSDENAWTKFLETNKQLVITWSSRYFAQKDESLRATTLPTTGQPFTMVKGWGWAIATPDPNEQVATAELARFLSEAEFVGPWTQATYLLPLRPFALSYWENEANQIFASQILPLSNWVPAPNVINLVSPPITAAVLDVLTEVHSPEDAAQIAADSLNE